MTSPRAIPRDPRIHKTGPPTSIFNPLTYAGTMHFLDLPNELLRLIDAFLKF